MITKVESRSGHDSLEQNLGHSTFFPLLVFIRVGDGYSGGNVGKPSYTSTIREESNRPFNIGDSPPCYDDPRYISSPISFGRSDTTTWPLRAQEHPASVSGLRAWHSASGSAGVPIELETERNHALRELERNMSALQAVRSRAAQPKQVDADDAEREAVALEELVLENMCRLAIIQPDSHLRAEWRVRAEAFMRTMTNFRLLGPQSSLRIELQSEADPNTYVDHFDNDEFAADETVHKKGKDSSSKSSPTLSSRVKRVFLKVKDDKGLSFITKGSIGLFIIHFAAPFLITYGAACVVYGTGKGAIYLGKKAKFASSSRKGTSNVLRKRAKSNPELSRPMSLKSPSKTLSRSPIGR
ncbi:hypothetical protein ACEPAG_2200 [Sanghuangporus baumii]